MEEQKPKFDWKHLLITTLIVLIAAGAVGGTTYYVLNSNFQKERDANEKALNDVQAQLKSEEAKDKTTSSSNTSTNTTTSNSGTLIRIPELGIQFTVNKEIADLYYSYKSSDQIAALSTRSLVAAGGDSCSPNAIPIGSIKITNQAPLKITDPNATPFNNEGVFAKQVGSKYIYFLHSQSVCSENQTAIAIQTSASNYIKAALLTAESIR